MRNLEGAFNRNTDRDKGGPAMKLLTLILAISLFASTALGAATMGLYFDYTPGKMTLSPEPWSFFDVYLYLHAAPYYITAVEYQLRVPSSPANAFFIYERFLAPGAVLELGDPLAGHSIAFWPPLNGLDPGYNMICKYTCLTSLPCSQEDGLAVYFLVVGPHPDSGALRGAYYPDNLLFPITGLTSILCPYYVGTEETSWGAIKGLYR